MDDTILKNVENWFKEHYQSSQKASVQLRVTIGDLAELGPDMVGPLGFRQALLLKAVAVIEAPLSAAKLKVTVSYGESSDTFKRLGTWRCQIVVNVQGGMFTELIYWGEKPEPATGADQIIEVIKKGLAAQRE